MKKNDPICYKHDEIIKLCKEIKQLDLSKTTARKKVDKLADKIITITEIAKDNGQSMEDRLSEYYDAITEIGFQRKKTRKRK